MHISFSRRGAIVASIALALTAAGCGSSTLDTGSGASPSAGQSSVTVGEVSADPSLVAKVPEAMKAKGTLSAGTDASYAPNEFFASDGTTIQGMDIDLMNAIGATLGLKVTYTNADFGTIIGGVTSGKYDVAVSSFTINPERMKQVNMVQYFSAGISWAARSGDSLDPNDACGKTVAVQTSTVQVPDTQAKSKKCVAEGKQAIKIISEVAQSKVAADVMAGKADAMSADSPVTAYAIERSNGKLQAAGSIYGTAPYGIVVAKDQTDFADAVSGALQKLNSDGVYESILQKWAVQDGAVSAFPVNPSS